MKPPRVLLPIGLAVALMGLPSLREAEAQRPAPVVDGALRGYLAVRLLDGGEYEVIEELNADRLFVPASVLKVVTVAAALEHLGAEYRWLTRLTSQGAIAGAVLDGDLVIEPGGDPTWGEEFFDGGAAEPLAALATRFALVASHGSAATWWSMPVVSPAVRTRPIVPTAICRIATVRRPRPWPSMKPRSRSV